jgi:hypothetical protein
VVAGEHYHAPDACLFQLGEHRLRFRPGNVHDGNDAEVPVFAVDNHGRVPFVFQFLHLLGNACRDGLIGQFLEQFPVADVDSFAFVTGFHAPAGDGLQVVGFRHFLAAQHLFCAFHDGGSQRVVARRFHRQRYFQQFFFARFTEWDSAGELGLALRQRTRFVESDGGQLPQIFERCAAFYQNACLRCPRHARQHGTRRKNYD